MLKPHGAERSQGSCPMHRRAGPGCLSPRPTLAQLVAHPDGHGAPAVQEVATVVHYQLPAAADMYVHRSGRTGRAGLEGTSIALVTPHDAPRFAALLQVARQTPQAWRAVCAC